jgi:hypothetical protein
MVTIATGNAMGAVRMAPPAAAKVNPIFLSTLKNFGVGAFTRLIIFIAI